MSVEQTPGEGAAPEGERAPAPAAESPPAEQRPAPELTMTFEDLPAQVPAPLPEGYLDELRRFQAWLDDANTRVNLTRICGEGPFVELHALDSLVALPVLDELMVKIPPGSGRSLVDVGSGCGVPGVPLALARPEWRVLLVESAQRKAKELEVFAATCDNLSVRAERAEIVGQDGKVRASFGAALVRAVGAVGPTLEYAMPLVRRGGVAILYRGATGAEDLKEAKRVAGKFGGGTPSLVELTLPSGAKRALLCVPKKTRTPKPYPRRPGLPTKEPI